jgi:hypothetical protein
LVRAETLSGLLERKVVYGSSKWFTLKKHRRTGKHREIDLPGLCLTSIYKHPIACIFDLSLYYPFINGYRISNFIHPEHGNSFKITIIKGARFRPEIQLMFCTSIRVGITHSQIVEINFCRFELLVVLCVAVPFLN